MGSLPIVKMLEEYGGDATIKNLEEKSPIDMTFGEKDLKEMQLYFMSL